MTSEEKQGLLKNICAPEERIKEYLNSAEHDSIQAEAKAIENLEKLADYFTRHPAEEDEKWDINDDAIGMIYDIIDYLKGH